MVDAKWSTSIEVTNDFPETYYQKQSFNWLTCPDGGKLLIVPVNGTSVRSTSCS